MIKKAINLIMLSIILSSNILFADDIGDNYITAKSLKINSIFQSNIELGSDIDFYRLPISKPGKLQVCTSGTTDTVGQLLDFNRTVLTESNDDKNGTNFFIEYNVNPGIYYVTVRSANEEASGKYILHVTLNSIQANESVSIIEQSKLKHNSHRSKNIHPFEYQVSCIARGSFYYSFTPLHCESVGCFSLPPGYVYINPISIKPDNNSCTWWPKHKVEILPGLELADKICIKATAISRYFGKQTHCSFSGYYISINQSEINNN
jgi:hypothetical protein